MEGAGVQKVAFAKDRPVPDWPSARALVHPGCSCKGCRSCWGI